MGDDAIKTKWTPGPWVAEPMVGKGAWIGNEGAWTALALGETEELARANKHIITAAPDLYDALERVLRYHGASISFDCTRTAERALAKARGE